MNTDAIAGLSDQLTEVVKEIQILHLYFSQSIFFAFVTRSAVDPYP
jgi:hypothetical protein